MKLINELKEEILKEYYLLWEANLSADMETFASYLVDDFSIIGSANGEVFLSKQAAIDFYTATADQLAGKAQLRNRDISIQPLDVNSVVIREQSEFYVLAENEWIFYGHARISCILKKTGEGWKAVHQHASLPDHRTEEGQQIAAEKIQKENLDLREAVKRRTVELESKNRELEIEAAVERVRAQSMAMQQTSDIAKVNEVLFAQISKLNIDGFTGVAIYLVDEEEMVTVWDLSSPASMGNADSYAFKYDPELTPTLSEFIPIWRAAKEEYFIMDYSKERLLLAAAELEPVYPAMAENFRTAIANGALQHQWNATATISHGILSLDMMKPPTEEVRSITLKMAAAFNLAHQRFYDLQKAAAQTRESLIQLALERVRARTMAMQHSNELADASFVLDTQVRSLDIRTWGCAFNIYGENESTEWFSSEAGMLPPYKTPREDFFLRAYEAGRRGEQLYIETFAGAACKAHYDYLLTIPVMGDALRSMLENGIAFPEKQIDHAVFFKYGYLLFITPEPMPDAHEVFIRFAKVFEQTYTRFLDLQKAEAQTREAQIEASLDRVRAKAMAMHVSDDLQNAVAVVFEELDKLNLGVLRVGISVLDKEKRNGSVWLTSVDEGKAVQVYGDESFDFHPLMQGSMDAWINQHDFYYVLEGDDLTRYYQAVEAAKFGLPQSQLLSSGNENKRQTCYVAVYNAGGLFAFMEGDFPEEAKKVMRRFAAVFDLTYKRFLDLQKAEAQALRAEQDVVAIKAARQKAEEALNELKETQKQLIQSEKMASLGELTAGIAHEIQNPLNFVNNFSEINIELINEARVQQSNVNIEELHELLNDIAANEEKINHHGKRADAIVKGMLQHSQSAKGQKQATDINALCDEYLRLSYHGLRAKDKSFNATLKTQFDESIGKINIVPQDIGRVIMNLLTNAFYAVNEKQKMTTDHRLPTTDDLYQPTVGIKTKKINDKIEIKISDNGNGIPSPIIDKIFQPFFTTKPTGQGTGLGLSLAYDIVKAHDGELSVDTVQTEGTTFIIQIPAS
ncbi:MAG: nuclear transport factor 2 family protein [Rhizobacter sp.]|nr:nuclear transport factor 2 family protein [Ferruginibacter sp.]